MTRKIMPFVLAVLSGLSVALAQACAPALAQVAAEPELWSPPDVEAVLARGLVGALVVSSTMIFARALGKRWLAPTPATEASRLLNLGLVLVIGIGAGVMHAAPQVAPGNGGWILGGVISAALAAYGRDAVVVGARVLGRRK